MNCPAIVISPTTSHAQPPAAPPATPSAAGASADDSIESPLDAPARHPRRKGLLCLLPVLCLLRILCLLRLLCLLHLLPVLCLLSLHRLLRILCLLLLLLLHPVLLRMELPLWSLLEPAHGVCALRGRRVDPGKRHPPASGTHRRTLRGRRPLASRF